jgi:hypothetical protein
MLMTGSVISDLYRKQNTELHKRCMHYGISAGERWGPHVLELIKEHGYADVVDYGCGKGSLGKLLREHNIPCQDYDPAIVAKCVPPQPADLVVCVDVMEHVEPEFLDAVLADLARVTKKLIFFVISNQPASKTLSDGRNAHLIVRDPPWWVHKIREHFHIHGVKVNTEGQVETLIHARTK